VTPNCYHSPPRNTDKPTYLFIFVRLTTTQAQLFGMALQMPISVRLGMQSKKLSASGACVKKILLRLWKEQVAQDLVEYALLLVLISLVLVASIKTLATGVGKVYSGAASNLTVSGGGGGGGNGGGGGDGGGGGNGGGGNGGGEGGGGNCGGGNGGGGNGGGGNGGGGGGRGGN
jgi:Flp pilus assembly pilin Flp